MRGVPYTSAINNLMYAMVYTRLDIAHAIGVINWFLSNPSKEHYMAMKWILMYLKGTIRACLCFGGD